MKTKKLIRLLQEADPSGEEEVCVGNVDILAVYKEPAYWDGDLQKLIRDEENTFYNVIGAEIIRNGFKIQIYTHSIKDAILDNSELPVTGNITHKRAEEIETWREEVRKIDNEIENES